MGYLYFRSPTHGNGGRSTSRPGEKGSIHKGYLPIKVGNEGGEEEGRRFVVPVFYLTHPLFIYLLKLAEEEYGFDQKGTIKLPCHVDEFINIQTVIDRDRSRHVSRGRRNSARPISTLLGSASRRT